MTRDSQFQGSDWLVERLNNLGAQPIDPATQSQHLTAMATAAIDETHRVSFLGRVGRRVQLGAAVAVGVLLGTTGLATAGALGPLQPIASTAVEAVTPLDVPNGKAKGHDKVKASEADSEGTGVERVTEGCEQGISTRNRGQYLKGIREKYGNESAELAAAKLTRCGMPVNSEGTPGADDDSEPADASAKDSKSNNGKGNDDADDADTEDDGSGKPADAGKPDDAGKPADVGSQGKTNGFGVDHGTGKPEGVPPTTTVAGS